MLLKEIPRTLDWSDLLIEESIVYNKYLLRLPGKYADVELDLKLSTDEMYKSALIGEKILVEKNIFRLHIKRAHEYHKDPKQWAKEVVWYGHRRAAYLYGLKSMDSDIAGHY